MTLWRRIKDAARTFGDGNPSAAEARFRQLSSEAHDLIIELTKTTDRLGMVLAREAKRHSRAAESRIARREAELDAAEKGPESPETAVATGGDRKTQLRLAARARGIL